MDPNDIISQINKAAKKGDQPEILRLAALLNAVAAPMPSTVEGAAEVISTQEQEIAERDAVIAELMQERRGMPVLSKKQLKALKPKKLAQYVKGQGGLVQLETKGGSRPSFLAHNKKVVRAACLRTLGHATAQAAVAEGLSPDWGYAMHVAEAEAMGDELIASGTVKLSKPDNMTWTVWHTLAAALGAVVVGGVAYLAYDHFYGSDAASV